MIISHSKVSRLPWRASFGVWCYYRWFALFFTYSRVVEVVKISVRFFINRTVCSCHTIRVHFSWQLLSRTWKHMTLAGVLSPRRKMSTKMNSYIRKVERRRKRNRILSLSCVCMHLYINGSVWQGVDGVDERSGYTTGRWVGSGEIWQVVLQ